MMIAAFNHAAPTPMRISTHEFIKIDLKELEDLCKKVRAQFKKEKKPDTTPFYMEIENGQFISVTDKIEFKK